MDLSILVVSYCTRELTLACLASVYSETSGIEFEVLVLDNASDDGSAEAIAREFPEARLWALEENLGFGRANNLLAREALGEWLLLLNPDTLVRDGAVQALVAFARAHPGRGIYGGRTLLPDGSLDPTSCWGRITLWSAVCDGLGLTSLFPRTRLFDPESLAGWQRDSVREVDIVVGCFFLIPKPVWEELGGFDPVFFMYGEEADLCLRAIGAGYRPTITPSAAIVHYGGASERIPADKQVRILRARVRLMRRHLAPWKAALAVRLLLFKAFSRSAISGLVERAAPTRTDGARRWHAAWTRRSEWIGG